MDWILIVYKIPSEPSRYRVSLWRKLKELGAVYLQQAVCLLPATDLIQPIIQQLQADITEMNGISYIFQTKLPDSTSEKDIVSKFNEERDTEYQELIEHIQHFYEDVELEIQQKHFTFGELEEHEGEYDRIQRWLSKIQARDYFQANLSGKAQKWFEKCEPILNTFSEHILAHNEAIDNKHQENQENH
ncbi:MAG: hypothetical protein PHD83_01635 [Caldisericia bacterium]|nr:hypothetical protein [Caldisericia bacterium]